MKTVHFRDWEGDGWELEKDQDHGHSISHVWHKILLEEHYLISQSGGELC